MQRIHLFICPKTYKNAANVFIKFRPFSCSRPKRQSDGESESSIIVEKDSNITLIGLNRENQRNSINVATAQDLIQAIHEFEADDTSPVAVLYGVGGSFCAGYDLKELEKQVDEKSFDFLMRNEGSVGPTRRHLRKPIVCGINGFCVAAGLELALQCDLRVMEDTAVLGFFNRRLGVPLSDGGSVRLAAAIGYSRAMDLILTGRRVEAKEALRIGLINRLVATGTALGQAVNLAFCIAKYPMASLQHDRHSIYRNYYDRIRFSDAIRNEIIFDSNDIPNEIYEGIQRFKNSKTKGPKTDAFVLKEKPIPDWEKAEIEHEKQYAKLKANKKDDV